MQAIIQEQWQFCCIHVLPNDHWWTLLSLSVRVTQEAKHQSVSSYIVVSCYLSWLYCYVYMCILKKGPLSKSRAKCGSAGHTWLVQGGQHEAALLDHHFWRHLFCLCHVCASFARLEVLVFRQLWLGGCLCGHHLWGVHSRRYATLHSCGAAKLAYVLQTKTVQSCQVTYACSLSNCLYSDSIANTLTWHILNTDFVMKCYCRTALIAQYLGK